MSVTCDDIFEFVASGDQGVENRPEFLAHLKVCARCREEAPDMLAAARTIRSAPAPALSGHLTPDQIVALALHSDPAWTADPGPADPAESSFAQHVAACPTCEAEIHEVRRAEETRPLDRGWAVGPGGAWADPPPPHLAGASFASRRMAALLAPAAGLAVLLLAYPAFLGIYRLPRVQVEMRALASRTLQLETQVRDLSASDAPMAAMAGLSGWSKPLRLFSLASPVRGQRTLPSIRVDAAEPYVLLSVRPLLIDPTGDAEVYWVALVDAGDRVVWRSELSVGEIREQMKSSGALILPIASVLLMPGRHELRVLPIPRPPRPGVFLDSPPPQPILQIPFEVVSAQSPTATNPAQ